MLQIYMPNGDVITIQHHMILKERTTGNIDIYNNESKQEYLGTIHTSGIIMLGDKCKHYRHPKLTTNPINPTP